MSFKEEMQVPLVCEICMKQGEPSTNSPFSPKFVIFSICIASTAELFIILVQNSITYSSIVAS